MTMRESRRFRWAVLGTGTIAGKFAAQLAQTEQGVCHGVAAGSQASADRFARAHGFARAYPSYDALLADPELDAIYVATPNRLHLEHCTRALGRKLAVLCEKPLAMSAAEGREIAGVARAQGVFCMEAMWMRFHPLVQQLRAWIREGRLGEVRRLQASLGWAKERERVERPELGRGAALDFGVYPLSLAHFLLGNLLGKPDAVTVEVRKHASGVDMSATVELAYGQGPTPTRASLAMSVCEQLGNEAVVEGTRASAYLRRPLLEPSGLHLVEHAGVGRITGSLAGLVAPLRGRAIPKGIGLRREAEELMRCVAAGRLESEVVPLDASIDVLEWVDRVRAG